MACEGEKIFALTGQSLEAYQRCMERKVDSVSDDTQLESCKSKYEKEMTDVDIDVTGEYATKVPTVSFHVDIANNSKDVVITRIISVIRHVDDNNRTTFCDSATQRREHPLWVEPGDYGWVYCRDLDFLPEWNRVSNYSEKLWSWNIEAVYGFKLH